MWIFFWTIIMSVCTVLLYKLTKDFVNAFAISAIIVVLTFFITVCANEWRIRTKFDSLDTQTLTEHFQPVYDARDYCHITTDNYTENRQIIINSFKFPERLESKLSGKKFYRFELCSTDAYKPFELVVIEDKHLNIIIIDGVVPCFKKINSYLEINTPGGLKWVLPKECFEVITKNQCGVLYLPEKPIYKEDIIPDFLEFDLTNSYLIMDAIK